MCTDATDNLTRASRAYNWIYKYDVIKNNLCYECFPVKTFQGH